MPKEKTNHRKKKESTPAEVRAKDFIDMTVPGILKFNPDHYICGSTYRCVWALREYPTTTDEKALLRHLGEKGNVILHVYSRAVSPVEERKIIQNAANKHKMDSASTSDISQSIGAEANLRDVAALVQTLRDNREPLLHCAVFIELIAKDMEELKLLQTEVYAEMTRSKLNVDKLLLRQQQGFLSVMPGGANRFGEQFERALPASSVANLYPFNYSGKTDSHGFYIGRDKFGSNIIVDLDKREDDKTNGSCLILGNSGQGKSYLLNLLLCNLLESGKRICCLDPEHERYDICHSLGGTFSDLMSGQYRINPLQPKTWDDGSDAAADKELPAVFSIKSKLSQHISFLKDWFRTYKDFTDREIDIIEILISKLYAKWDITDQTDFKKMKPTDFPILSDLYDLGEAEYKTAVPAGDRLYTAEALRDILLGLHSMCKGADAVIFNGHTNIESSRFVVFGVKSLLQASRNVKDTMLFNILSYMSDLLLTEGNAVCALDELYLFLTNPVAIEYIRGFMKRCRKRDSLVILASQNLEDFNIDGIRELTKPLFSIPTHVFLFNAGNIDSKFYMDTLQIEESEFKLIQYPQRGACLYKCGNERYNLLVHAPEHKARLFGKVGGR